MAIKKIVRPAPKHMLPAKRVPMRKTTEQLKSTVWPDKAAAIAELKACRVPASTDDYELGEYRRGSWQLMPREAVDDPIGDLRLTEIEAKPDSVARQALPIREQAVRDALVKKPGAKPKGEPEVLLEAKAPLVALRKAVAKGVKKNGAIVEIPPVPRDKAKTISLFAEDDEPGPEPAPEPVKAEPAAVTRLRLLYSPLAKEDGPYELILRADEGDVLGQHNAHTAAKWLAQHNRHIVRVRDANGQIVRTYDPAELRELEKANKLPRPAVPRAVGARVGGESKFSKAIALLTRPKGATARELEAACDWQNVTQRYANKASRMTGKKLITIAERHWRLAD